MWVCRWNSKRERERWSQKCINRDMKECHLLEHKNDFTKLNVSTQTWECTRIFFNWIQTSLHVPNKAPSNAMHSNCDIFLRVYRCIFLYSVFLRLSLVHLCFNIYCNWMERNIPKKNTSQHSQFRLRFIDLVKYFRKNCCRMHFNNESTKENPTSLSGHAGGHVKEEMR